jgi:acylphosphatase
MKVAHILIFGQVQGVGYRQFVKKEAKKLGLVGWVRNLPEGTVEAEVNGLDESIEKFIKACKKGPYLSEVKAVDVDWQEKDFPYREFVIRHDMD